jgi:uncharacterized protein (DUF1697 family)
MPTHVALLRGINVGGHNLIAMSDLRDFLEERGLTGAKTLLQSGNAVFSSRRTGAGLERWLESEAKKRFELSIDYFVRTATEWDAIIAANPFPKEAERDPSHLLVLCLKKAADPKDVKSLQEAIKGPEQIRVDGKQLYAVYPAGIAGSKLTITLIEKKLGTRTTGRNWNTVRKLAALAKGLDSGPG